MRLRTKATWLLLALSLVAGVSIAGLAKRAIHRSLVREAEKNAWSRISGLEGPLAEAFRARQERPLLRLLGDIQAKTGAQDAAALEPSGRVLAHTNVALKGSTLPIQRGGGSVEGEQQGLAVLVVSVPVRAADEELLLGGAAAPPELGQLRLRLSLVPVHNTEREVLAGILAVLAVCGAAVLLTAVLLMRRWLAPIQALEAATRRVARGEYGAQVSVASADELGALARSFNEMSATLSRSSVSIGALETEARERRRAEAAVRASEEMLSKIFQESPMGIAMAGPDFKFHKANPAFCRILGYREEELQALSLQELTAPEDMERSLGALARLESGERQSLSFEKSCVRKDGARIPISMTLAPVRDAQARIQFWLGIVEDITERKRLQGIMLQSEKMAAVGQLAAGVAHEINNPLGVILGFAQALAAGIAEDDALHLPVTSIQREALRCKHLVQDLLTFSRASKEDRKPVDLNEVVAGALTLINAKAKLAQIEVRRDLTGDLPPVRANMNQLQQVVINLAANALDAMPAGGTLNLRTGRERRAGREQVVLWVCDDGSGIPPELLPRIFEPFVSTKRVGQGTGLGLSLVHEIVTRHGGDIEVESAPGRTVFTVRLPAAGGDCDPRTDAAASDGAGAGPGGGR